jgi:HTH-type transcriptional regulator/antitoxin MqsA
VTGAFEVRGEAWLRRGDPAMTKVKTQPCLECGGEMRYEKHDDVLTYRDQATTIKTLGWWCSKCGEAILTGEPLVEHERAFLEFKAEVDGVLGPAEVANVRTKLHLTQRRAGELLGGGPRAFQKYEAGTQAVSLPMANLLRLLANDPSRLAELKKSFEKTRARSAPAVLRADASGPTKSTPNRKKRGAASSSM